MSTTPTTRTTCVLPLAQIDRPDLDARIARDPEKLEELSRDILRRGLIEPIKVFVKGDRYEVVDGFRRFLATQAAGLTAIECFIYETKSLALEGVKYAANIFREDMSPAEEAIMFRQLLADECAGDIERLCALVGKRLSYVDARLALVGGDELVFEAVKDRKITLGVAEQLNKIDKSDYCRYYLEHAIKTGATVSVVTGWVTEYKTLYGDHPQLPAQPEAPAGSSGVVLTYDPSRCAVCGKSDHRMTVQVNAHPSCNEAILQPLLATYRGDDAAGG
jgi:ParB family chromosome partitioning protein